MRIGGATSRLVSVVVFPLGFPTSVMQMQRLKILSNYHHTPFDLFMHVNLPQLKSKLTSPYGITLFGASCCDRYAGDDIFVVGLLWLKIAGQKAAGVCGFGSGIHYGPNLSYF
ncbi:uncharacterized protein K444DRAFT_125992 [Hyaloscypha bicolor E]|uniref:Uncharacterized protein n=1 Tax=Hyaloscypha bicolor E TaxID=1095630 RepID=A0A2J6TUS5_9HELO|nr:uncharacterized protein K444DRAFT_125992 [Hyaloscypha bicolor E]PMD66779.1 hypothetical protein K444DRAFT_125992 [Hyaloscypha bicolor E]